jgi:hypothetical protein
MMIVVLVVLLKKLSAYKLRKAWNWTLIDCFKILFFEFGFLAF